MKSTLRSALIAAAAATLVITTAAVATASVTTDSYYYNVGDTVHIMGDEMSPGEAVVVQVSYPDGSLAQSHEVAADESGNFTDTYTLPTDAPAGIYGVQAIGQDSGGVFTTTFDPPSPDPTLTTIQFSDDSIVYGQGITLSGRVTKPGPAGVPNADVTLSASTVSCLVEGVPLGTATGSTGTPATAGSWAWPDGSTWRPNAGTWYVKAAYGGRGQENALLPSSACATLVVAKAPTATSITNSPAISLGLGSAFNLDYLVRSGYGVTGNLTSGTVSVSQQDGPANGLCGSQASSSVTLSENQVNADGTGGVGDGFSAIGSLSCTPSAIGSYTYRVAYSGDANYDGSVSTPDQGLEVTELTVNVCKAAPAIAVEYMKVKGVKPNQKTWNTVVSDVARRTGSRGEFFAKFACDSDYAAQVTGYIATTYRIV